MSHITQFAHELDKQQKLSRDISVPAVEATKIDLSEVAVLHHPGRPQKPVEYRGETVAQRDLDVANKSHWWLLARRG